MVVAYIVILILNFHILHRLFLHLLLFLFFKFLLLNLYFLVLGNILRLGIRDRRYSGMSFAIIIIYYNTFFPYLFLFLTIVIFLLLNFLTETRERNHTILIKNRIMLILHHNALFLLNNSVLFLRKTVLMSEISRFIILTVLIIIADIL